MRACARLARQYEGVRLHTHLAECKVGRLSCSIYVQYITCCELKRLALLACTYSNQQVRLDSNLATLPLHSMCLCKFTGQRLPSLSISNTFVCKSVCYVQGDLDYCQATYGYRFGKYIQSIEWDQSDCWFAHCCLVDQDEMSQLAAGCMGVAHCPSSNLRLASGIAPVRWVTKSMAMHAWHV